MSVAETIQKLKEILVTKLKLDVGMDEINEHTQLFGANGLGLDSIDVLELVVDIKKTFGVEIIDRKTAEQVFTSVGAIAQYIEDHKPAATKG